MGELSVELAWDGEHRALIQDRAAPVGTRRCKCLSRCQSAESVKPTGFGFGGASASGTAFGTGANGSVVFGFSAGTPTQWWLWHNLAYPAVLLVAKPRVLSPSASKAKH